MSKIIVFEEIYNLHKWIIKYYSLKGYKIYFLRISIFSKNSDWVKVFLEKGIIEKLNLDYFIKGSFDTCLYENAFDNIETFYKGYSKDLANSMVDVSGTEDVELCFKNKLNRDLARFYYLNDVISKIKDKLHSGDIYFVPYNRVGREKTANEGTYLYKY